MSRTPRRACRARRSAKRAIGTAALLLAVVGTGCGIRATDVPVDGGPAPTRVTCDPPARDGEGIDVYLVCGLKVKSVRRSVESLGSGNPQDPTAVANALLDELQTEPAGDEEAAGFHSDVPTGLSLWGPVSGGARPVVRLSEDPGELSISALLQIICTFAHNDLLGNGQSVTLGGPPGSTSARPKAYPCSAVRHSHSGEPSDADSRSGPGLGAAARGRPSRGGDPRRREAKGAKRRA